MKVPASMLKQRMARAYEKQREDFLEVGMPEYDTDLLIGAHLTVVGLLNTLSYKLDDPSVCGGDDLLTPKHHSTNPDFVSEVILNCQDCLYLTFDILNITPEVGREVYEQLRKHEFICSDKSSKEMAAVIMADTKAHHPNIEASGVTDALFIFNSLVQEVSARGLSFMVIHAKRHFRLVYIREGALFRFSLPYGAVSDALIQLDNPRDWVAPTFAEERLMLIAMPLDTREGFQYMLDVYKKCMAAELNIDLSLNVDSMMILETDPETTETNIVAEICPFGEDKKFNVWLSESLIERLGLDEYRCIKPPVLE